MVRNIRFYLVAVLMVAVMLIGASTVFANSNTKQFKNGVYKASESSFDDYGWKAFIVFSVEDKKIKDVWFDYVNAEGMYKKNTDWYLELYTVLMGMDFVEKITTLESSLVTTQDPDAVDAVSGATASSDKFKALASQALDKGPVRKITVEPTRLNMTVGDENCVTVTGVFADGTTEDFSAEASYKSFKPGVCTVDNGVISAKGKGNTIIHVNVGNFTKVINVKVTD